MSTSKEYKELNVTVDLNNVLEGVKSIISKLRPQWNKKNITYKVFNEGISNQLTGCFYGKEPPILVRVYGIGTELFIDREVEKHNIVKISKAGLGPDLIASFTNGLAYYYVPGDILTVNNVSSPLIWPLVARKLGKMHQIPVNQHEAEIWKRLDNFLNLLPDSFGEAAFGKFATLYDTKESLSNEVKWIKSKLEVTTSPVVFAHNDLLLANILLNKEKSDVIFIDYEYGCPNYQAFDIANHFNEYAGVEKVDYSKVPSLDYQRKWIGEYLQIFESAAPTPDQVESVLLQTQKFMTLSHVFWGLWSLVQAIHSKIEFDYPEYACIRFRKYIEIKSILEK